MEDKIYSDSDEEGVERVVHFEDETQNSVFFKAPINVTQDGPAET